MCKLKIMQPTLESKLLCTLCPTSLCTSCARLHWQGQGQGQGQGEGQRGKGRKPNSMARLKGRGVRLVAALWPTGTPSGVMVKRVFSSRIVVSSR